MPARFPRDSFAARASTRASTRAASRAASTASSARARARRPTRTSRDAADAGARRCVARPTTMRARIVARALARSSAARRGMSATSSTRADALRERRTFTADDCAAFARLTGDGNPIHFDDGGAGDRENRLRGRAVHGMLAASAFGALLARARPGTVYASQELKFREPVRVDEEMEIELKLVKRSGTRARYETVVRKVKCGTVCVDGHALALLPEE